MSLDLRRRIAGCGPVVRLGLGTWATFGDGSDFVSARQVFFRALDAGLNHIDTAASYAGGVAEEWLGRFLSAAEREHLVVSTKVFHTVSRERGPAIGGLGRKAIGHSVDGSLRRLRTDRLDTCCTATGRTP